MRSNIIFLQSSLYRWEECEFDVCSCAVTNTTKRLQRVGFLLLPQSHSSQQHRTWARSFTQPLMDMRADLMVPGCGGVAAWHQNNSLICETVEEKFHICHWCVSCHSSCFNPSWKSMFMSWYSRLPLLMQRICSGQHERCYNLSLWTSQPATAADLTDQDTEKETGKYFGQS